MNTRQIKDLFNMEEMMTVNLDNCNYHLNIYIEKLDKVQEEKLNDEQLATKGKLSGYFAYYKNQLIPALDEILELDKKHGALLEANPDPSFSPIAIEFKNHKKLMDDFFLRFEDLHQELYDFLKAVK